MWKCARLVRFPLTILVLATACDDDDDTSGPDGTSSLSEAEATTLGTVVSSGIEIDPETAPLLAHIIGQIREHGTITFASASASRSGSTPPALARLEGDYDAVTFQALVEFGGDPPTIATGILGWRGIDPPAIVAEYFLVIALEDGDVFPSSGSAVIPSLEAEAVYYEDATGSSYSGTSGSFSWEGASFGGSSSDCSTDFGLIHVNCSYLEGSMAGSLGFEAALVEGTGAETVTFAATDFDLPGLRYTVNDEPAPTSAR
jgi:hypothetical protein